MSVKIVPKENAGAVLLGAFYGLLFGTIAVPVTSEWLDISSSHLGYYFIFGMFACIMAGTFAGSRVGLTNAKVRYAKN